MEIGKLTELRCLTPTETGWVQRALDALHGRGDAMAREVLANAEGRKLACEGGKTTPEPCPHPPSHYTVSNGTMRCYCAHHWRQDVDPANQLGLESETENKTSAST